VFVLFIASAVQCATGHWTRCGMYSWIMDLFNVYKRYKSFH